MIPLVNLEKVNAFLDLVDKGKNATHPEPAVVVIEGAHGTGKVKSCHQHQSIMKGERRRTSIEHQASAKRPS